jgi:PD-(D/E)XK nuclease superfamily protein
MAESMKMSFSKLETFSQCERKGWYQYIDKRPQKPNFYFDCGNYLHSLAERFLLKQTTEVKPGRLVTPELLKHLDLAYARLEREVLEKVTAKPQNVERRFSDNAWSGKLDVIFDTGPEEWGLSFPLVADFKTAHSRKFMKRNAADSPQLAKYALEAKVTSAAFIEVDLFPPYEVRILGTKFSPEMLEWWARWLETQRVALLSRGPNIENYKLAAPGDPLCSVRWCPFWQECAGGNNKKETK